MYQHDSPPRGDPQDRTPNNLQIDQITQVMVLDPHFDTSEEV
jgi:hypothetical protein